MKVSEYAFWQPHKKTVGEKAQEEVERFLDECVDYDRDGKARAGKTYEAYRRWLATQGDDSPMTFTVFGHSIVRLKIVRVRDSHGFYYANLSVHPEWLAGSEGGGDA